MLSINIENIDTDFESSCDKEFFTELPRLPRYSDKCYINGLLCDKCYRKGLFRDKNALKRGYSVKNSILRGYLRKTA